MTWRRLAALTVGAGAFGLIIASVGTGSIVRDVAQAGGALPIAIAVHAVQLALSGVGWWIALGAGAPSLLACLRIRWIKEGVNTLLPAAQIGGQVVGVRLLVRAGATPPLAVAATILDLVLEAVSQLLMTLLAVATLLLLREGDRDWLMWVAAGLGATALGVTLLALAVRFGALRLVERTLQGAALRWPATAGWSMTGLHSILMARQADRPAMLNAVLAQGASWSLGAVEVWVILHALGHDVGLGQAFVIESLAMAARSAGFAIPGAVGVQEGGFVLACGLFGLSPEAGLALSVLKRLRELAVSAAAVAVWQFVDDGSSVLPGPPGA